MKEGRLDIVGIGSMVVDRVHRAPRLLGAEQKGILRSVGDAGPVQTHVGGVVLNHLGWAAALGAKVGIFGRQAPDANGAFLREAMDRAGIERDITLDGEASSFAEIFVDDAGERAIYMAPGATSATTGNHVAAHGDFVRRASALTTEISQLPIEAVQTALDIAREAGIPTVVDLDLPPSDAVAAGLGDMESIEAALADADLLKPAKSAARELAPDAGDDALALAKAMRARFGNGAVVVTDGAAGCAIAADGFEGFVPAPSVKAVDTTGAGDAFLGGLLVGLDDTLDWERAALLANACGAACVEQIGAFPNDPMAARARVLALYQGPALALSDAPRPEPPPLTSAAEALASFDIALEELAAHRARLDEDQFESALAILRAARERGSRVHVTGVGKTEHVSLYVASLLSSTGTPATFLHATEAAHGSAGQVVEGDVVIALSNSGGTAELKLGVQAARGMGAHIIGVTGKLTSWLAEEADAVLDAGVSREGGPLGFAPRASIAAEILVLASLSAAVEREIGLTPEQYNLRHRAGALGKASGKK
jgi:arabinose-5-phosphate isomerase